MNQSSTLRASKTTIALNKVKTFFSKPHNVILLLLGIVLTFTTVAPIVAIVEDTFKIHAGTIDAHLTGQASGYTTVNYIDLFTSRMAKTNLWTPLGNTVLLAVGTCVVSILYGGLFAFLITRTDLAWRKYLSSIFIFPYIMPQWTLAVVWQNLFNSNAVTGTSNGLLAALFGVNMPMWWCKGLFPSLMVLGLHYAPFAYILIGGIFRNMDANLEEAATILDTPKWKTMFRITLPMVKPAILSTILLVFGSAMGSYPVPHYLGLSTLSTKYVSMNSKYTGEASILAIIMMVFGVAIMLLNQLSLRSRKNYTTVTGKSGQISKITLGKYGKYIIAILLVILTFFTSIFPIISFAFETFLPNPGGMELDTTKGKIAGFEEAAKYVGEKEGKTVELLNVPYANSFSDAPKGKEFATELISQGADVFFGDASAVDSGAREAIDAANAAAGEVKIYDIGQPADILGQNECIICSQVTDNSAMVAASMEAVEAGTFGGEVLYGTLQNGTLSAGALSDLVPADVQEKYLSYIEEMKNDTFMK